MRPASSLAVTALLLVLLAGCDRPAPPAYAPPPDAAVVATPSAPLSLDTSLAALPDAERANLVDGARGLRLAYDGRRVIGEVTLPDATPDEDCPVGVYVGTDGGAHRHAFSFTGAASGGVTINGSPFGGSAPRTRSVDGVLRFLLPALGGDLAVHVADCEGAPLLPTVAAALDEHGGLRWGPVTGPLVVGLGALDADGALQPDAPRYDPGDRVALLGAGLEALTSARVGVEDARVDVIAPHLAGLTVPPGAADADALVPSAGDVALHAVALTIDGPVKRIGDTMESVVGAVWGTWLVILLVSTGLILTIVNGFPQIRGFAHAIGVVRGRYDNPDEEGEINHFQALTTALSATVGLGNIAGVAVALTNGGPGALFWMWVCGFLGMATKYTECTLSTATREVRPDGSVAGGPMYYMKKYLPAPLRWLAVVYAVFITVSSFGGGNMFQANQAAALWNASFGVPTWVTGLVLVLLVGLVIIGGIRRIGRVTDKLVPTMCGLYVLGALAVIFVHIDLVPGLFGTIFSEAFSVSAAVGGTLGIVIKDVLVQGFRRAAFSNEAGFGSAAIAHAAVKTDEPVREGVVALLEPFIDTIVVCTMTGLVILISGVWIQQGLDGAPLTAAAFDSAFDGFGSLLVPIAVFLFAVSTMISWSYYGEKGIEFFLGRRAIVPYRIFFVGLIFIGAVWKLGPVLNFSDATFGLVAVPNLIAILLLAPRIRALSRDYFGRLKRGEMVRYK